MHRHPTQTMLEKATTKAFVLFAVALVVCTLVTPISISSGRNDHRIVVFGSHVSDGLGRLIVILTVCMFAAGVIMLVTSLVGWILFAVRDHVWLTRLINGCCSACGYELKYRFTRCSECGHQHMPPHLVLRAKGDKEPDGWGSRSEDS